MSVIWLCPFVFLVLQSFRSYASEAGGMVNYIVPKQFSLDNYIFLCQGAAFSLKLLVKDAAAIAITVVTNLAGLAVEGIRHASKHRIDADTRRRVVTQLITQLAADAVANACFVGGQVKVGHAGAPLEKRAHRLANHDRHTATCASTQCVVSLSR